MARRLAIVALVAVLAACATGNADWRRESYLYGHLELQHAGDGRCSDPAPYTSIRACLVHDAAYEMARRFRCTDDPLGYSSAQSRLIADLLLAANMAQDGYPQWWVATYYYAVRVGGIWPWYFGGTCP
jgi:hypothetical protein